MSSNASNFTCFSSDLSRDSITEGAWALTEDRNPAGVIVIGSILIIIVAIGIPWNAAVLAALIYNKFYKQPSLFLLFNLASVDLLTCIMIIPFQAVPGLLGGRYTLGNSDYTLCQSCQAGVVVIIWLLYSAIHIIAVMSVDRLVYIRKPLQYEKWITVPRLAVVLAVLYIVCIIVAIPPVFQFGAIQFSQVVGTCTTVFGVTTRVGPSFLVIAFYLLEALIPVGVLVVANILLLVFVRRGIRTRFESTYRASGEEEVNKKAKRKYHAQQVRMVKVFSSIFASNFLTWVPSILVLIIVAGIGTDNVAPGVFSLVFLLFLIQSLIHPVLESLLSGKIRSITKKIFCSCCKTRKSVEVTKTSFVSSTKVNTTAT